MTLDDLPTPADVWKHAEAMHPEPTLPECPTEAQFLHWLRELRSQALVAAFAFQRLYEQLRAGHPAVIADRAREREETEDDDPDPRPDLGDPGAALELAGV